MPFRYIAISVGEEGETVRDFIGSSNYTFTNLLDVDSEVSALYGIRSHPMKFLINQNGELLGVAGGYKEWDTDEMKTLMRKLIGNKG